MPSVPAPRRPRLAALSLLFLLPGCATAPRSGPPRPASIASIERCFAVDTLPPAVRAVAERVLLEAGDGEALYTLAGGLKPISPGRSFSYPVLPALPLDTLTALDELRRATRALSCGDIGVFVQPFTALQFRGDDEARRAAQVVVFHRSAVAALVRRHATYFGTLGITPAADVREVVAAVENAPRADRWRGYGLLFGYPEDAVQFFVDAGLVGDSTGAIVPRDFVRIETFTKFPERAGEPATLSSFEYAVPRGRGISEADRRLQALAAPIYARYLSARALHARDDSTGAVALWREWLRPQATERPDRGRVSP
jgi:hypothetical protein